MIGIICMVKNEAESIFETLNPFINKGFTKILINDTGSTDNTLNIVKEKIPSVTIFENQFIDFATNRNIALNVAKLSFYDTSFLLFIDCEWYSKDIDKLISFCENEQKTLCDYYNLSLIIDGNINLVSRLFTINTRARYEGNIHEQLNGICGGLVPEFFLISKPTTKGLEKTIKRIIEYDIPYYLSVGDDLSQEQIFHFAQSYFNIRHFDKSFELYSKITHPKLIYVSLYRIAIIYLMIDDIDNAIRYFSMAILNNKNRCETYVMLAKIHNDYNKYDFAKIACSCIMNVGDIFNNYDLWNYDRYIELVKGCLITKKFKEGLGILEKLPVNHETSILRERLSRKIVILILNSPGYDEYNDKLRRHLDNFEIPYYFYQYSNEDKNEEHNIFIKGEETFIPGILTKTIKVFEMFKDYDYIIRLNATTIIDLYKVDFDEDIRLNHDFFGYFNSCRLDVNEIYGVTQNFIDINGSIEFISGKCMILSKIAIKKLLESDIDYSVMDDVAISLVLGRYFKIEHFNSYGYPDSIIKTIKL